MRVAIVNWTGRRVGGAETYVGLVTGALQQRGHAVYFWQEGDQPADRDPIPGLAAVPASCASAGGVEPALQALAAWRPDVLYVHGLLNPETEAGILKVGPTVFLAHGYYGTCISGSKTFRLPHTRPCDREFGAACLLNYFPRRCGGLNPLTMVAEYQRQSARLRNLRRCHAIVTLSEHMRREYLKHGFSEQQVHCLPPIDAMHPGHALSPMPKRTLPMVEATAGLPPRRLTFIGRTDRLKGCRLLIGALPAIQSRLNGPIVLTIAGDGPDLERCREAARRTMSETSGIDIVFLGWVPHARCEELLASTEVLVVPSLWPEPFGLVGPEAIRRGVPVAAFAVGAIPEWLEDGRTGALASADPPTAEGLTIAVERCLTSPAIGRGVREQARQDLGYSIQQHLDALVPLLGEAAATAGRAGAARAS
jgi:glycosyltransferase involved in cell wall biosynthesis